MKPSCDAARIPVSARTLAGSSDRTGANPSTLDIQLSALIGLVSSSPGSVVGVVCAVALALVDAAGEWEAPGEEVAEGGESVVPPGAHAPSSARQAAVLATRVRARR